MPIGVNEEYEYFCERREEKPLRSLWDASSEEDRLTAWKVFFEKDMTTPFYVGPHRTQCFLNEAWIRVFQSQSKRPTPTQVGAWIPLPPQLRDLEGDEAVHAMRERSAALNLRLQALAAKHKVILSQ